MHSAFSSLLVDVVTAGPMSGKKTHTGPHCFVCDTTVEEERTSNDGGLSQGDDELSSSVSTRRQTWRKAWFPD
ncbi:hypothetical protein SISSUDRAFT_1052641 [Sistotremastrum suecicum HHB10207 ss-3]|uniref:Uncharacterized protein n=1 Tax=Sistotremastrum suecicum HHB10207 ss-3 TaxID=1314776 RepID=A0A165ZQY6_9AGAM|nr:hypothetical protein SISSUDRAFT_1052641 [Sistotremastrum suecicum HHB10207 ss-3]